MKAIIDVEFIMSVIVFMGIISFVSYSIISNIPIFSTESSSEDLRARAYEISELLLFDEGYPKNWNQGNIERLGLSSGERYVLDKARVNQLRLLCNTQTGYEKLRDSILFLKRADIKILITDPQEVVLADCSPAVAAASRSEFQITRFAVIEDGNKMPIVRVSVSIV